MTDFLEWKEDCKLTSVNCNKPLKFVTEGMLGFSFALFVSTVTLSSVVSLVSSVFSKRFCGKIRSEPWSKVLWVLEHRWFNNLRGCVRLCNECCPFKPEKQSLLSATNFVRWIGVFSRNTEQRHKKCFYLQAKQLVVRLSALSPIDGVSLELVDAQTLLQVFVLVKLAGGLLSSVFGFLEDHFILLCASTLSFNHSLNSSIFGRSQFSLAVCMDQASFKLGGSLRVAWPKNDAPQRS